MCAADVRSRRVRRKRTHVTPWSVEPAEHNESDKILTTFRELGVLPEICDALERAGIVTPFAIQEMTLSVALMGTDLIGQARTGTGKTLAFGIPVMQRSVDAQGPGVRRHAPGQAAGPHRRPDPRARAPGLQRPGPGQQGPRPARPHRLRRRGLRPAARRARSRASTSSSAPRAASSTWPTAAPSTCRTCTRWCSTRPTRCSTSGFLPDVEKLISMTPETRQTMLFSATMPAAIVGAGPAPHAAPDEHPRRVVVRHDDGARDRAVHLPGPRPRQARDHRPHPAGRGRRQDHRLHPHQAAGAAGRRRPRRARLQRPARCTATWRRWPARRR